jgi:hypothetical protein
VAKCHKCGTDTELFYGGVPACPKCAQALDERLEAGTRKPASQEPVWRSLAEVNRNLTAARDAYRKAHAARLKAEDLTKHLSPGHPDGTQALHNANQQLAMASERYEKALRVFIDFRPPSSGVAAG